LTIVIEVSGTYYGSKGISNTLIYNYFTSLEFLYYLFLLATFVYSTRFRRLIFYLMGAFFAFSMLNVHFIQKEIFATYSYSVGTILVVGGAILYFFDLFYTTASVKLIKEPGFWISTALLFYYCCTYPVMVSTNFLTNTDYSNLFLSILYMLNYFLYTLFAIAFLCQIRIKNSTLSSSQV